MLTSLQHQSWLFYLPLAKQVSLLKDDLLAPVDQLLDDPQLLELVRRCLAARYDAEATPDFTSFSKLFALLGPSVTEQIHGRRVQERRAGSGASWTSGEASSAGDQPRG
jgi:hypothetical protein